MDASRYRKRYETINAPHTPLTPTTEGCENVRMLWQKLMDAYIMPNGPREVNLPSNVRDELLSMPNDFLPPSPDCLSPAVKIIFELMDESVLVPFLNSVASSRGPQSCTNPWDDSLDQNMGASYEGRGTSPVRSRSRVRREGSPPTNLGGDVVSNSYRGRSPRLSHQSHLSAALRVSGTSRLSQYLSNVSSANSSSTDPAETALTDDSLSSPSPSALEPMTPPTTPPTSDVGFNMSTSPGTSPRIRDSGSSWKKLSDKLTWRKSRTNTQGSHSSTSTTSTSFPSIRDEEGDTTLT